MRFPRLRHLLLKQTRPSRPLRSQRGTAAARDIDPPRLHGGDPRGSVGCTARPPPGLSLGSAACRRLLPRAHRRSPAPEGQKAAPFGAPDEHSHGQAAG